MLRGVWQLLLASCVLACSALASAQDYPTRPVKIVVPFGAGGGTDALARFVARGLEQRLGQPFIIENRGGSGTTLGATCVARSEPDGYTIMLGTSSTFAIAPGLYKKLAYDPTKDFSPIMLLATVPFVLIGQSVARRQHACRSWSRSPRASPASWRTRRPVSARRITSMPSC